MHRKAERNELSDADMKYLQDTMEYRHESHVDCSSVSVDLSSIGMSMSELQQIEAQISAEDETDAATDAGAGTDITSGAAGAGVGGGSFLVGGSVCRAGWDWFCVEVFVELVWLVFVRWKCFYF